MILIVWKNPVETEPGLSSTRGFLGPGHKKRNVASKSPGASAFYSVTVLLENTTNYRDASGHKGSLILPIFQTEDFSMVPTETHCV